MSTIGNASYITLPALPHIITEWSALVPLIVHLASSHDEFQVIGEACLRGKICLDLMPKLGQLKGVARLLLLGSAVLDQTSSAGVAGSTTVWDVSWGSVFQCANGAARELLTAHAFRGKTEIIDVETTAPEQAGNGEGHQPQPKVDGKPLTKTSMPKNVAFCRPQVLHLVELRFNKASAGNKGTAASSLLERLCTVSGHVLVTALAGLLALCGAYGTCALLLLSCINALVSHRLPFHRPPGYLDNNETYDAACMLVAPHDNASTWHLYRGDRAIIDRLLNKPMLAITTERSCRWLFWYFQLTHYLQLLAMTYVAAQKGWDGLLLLVFMVISRLARSEAAAFMMPWSTRARGAAATWLQQNNIDVQTNTFRMAGRTQMIGAIDLINSMDQNKHASLSSSPLLSTPSSSPCLPGQHTDTGSPGHSTSSSTGSHTFNFMNRSLRANWMDSIIAHSPRREQWLERLSSTMLAQMQQLSHSSVKPDVPASTVTDENRPVNIPTLDANLVQQVSNPSTKRADTEQPSADDNKLPVTADRPSCEPASMSTQTNEAQEQLGASITGVEAPSVNAGDVDKPSLPKARGNAVSDIVISSSLNPRDVRWVDQNTLWAWETARCIIQSCAAASSVTPTSSQRLRSAQITAVQA
ncbi:hypothetical protein AYO20_02616 [Fonsecaea nubica]|uniref:Uncharacterized protein n=1 Tax=Fonsecaea nubica TaxID=856822 RepID=A0A178DA22_9EURO|nr:hypothetical protein AYO20_02616 [Fonsecaea nubica]OAL38164.1 hypothetical protein AYO20_02616 [Fonsecaea nubica]